MLFSAPLLFVVFEITIKSIFNRFFSTAALLKIFINNLM